jgi:hypothetical protein
MSDHLVIVPWNALLSSWREMLRSAWPTKQPSGSRTEAVTPTCATGIVISCASDGWAGGPSSAHAICCSVGASSVPQYATLLTVAAAAST